MSRQINLGAILIQVAVKTPGQKEFTTEDYTEGLSLWKQQEGMDALCR